MTLKPRKLSTLGDYATVIMGQSPESEYYTTDVKYMPFLQGNRTFGFKYPTFDTFTTKTTKIAPKGSVLVSVRAPVGDTNVAPSDLCIGRGVAAIVSKDPDNEYLYYLMKSLVPLMNQNENGSTFGSINRTDLEKMPIILPEYEDRYKIGHILSRIDAKIENNALINDYLLKQIDLLYDNWMLEKSTDVDETSDIEKWHIGSIYDFCKITYGAPFKSDLFNEDKKGLPLIRIRDLKTQSPQEYTEEQHPKATIILPGDVVIGMDAEFRPYIWVGEPGLLNQRVCKVTSEIENVTDYLVLLLLREELFKIESYKTGTTVSHIGKEDFDKISIIIPSRIDMINFSKIITPMIKMVVNNGIENRKLTMVRDTLLPKLMSGEIDISKLN